MDLKILQELESEYGSIGKVPNDDPRLKKLQAKMSPALKPHEPNKALIKRIKDLADKGFSYKDIAEAIDYSIAQVRSIMHDNNIKQLPFYKYKVTDENGTVMYCTDYQQIIKATGIQKRFVRGALDFKGPFHGFNYETIDPIAVGLPEGSLIFKNGRWKRV